MKFIEKNLTKILLACTLLFTVIVLLIVIFAFKVDNTRLDAVKPMEFEDNWYIIEDGEKKYLETVTRKDANAIEKELVIYNELPANGVYDTLSMYTKNEYIAVYIEDTLIYTYGYDNDIAFYNETGAVHNLINLNTDINNTNIDYFSKEIKIVITPYEGKFSSTGEQTYKICLGTQNDIITNIICENYFTIFICFILFIIGLFVLIEGFGLIITKSPRGFELLYFGLFILLSNVWILTDSLLLQFVSGNKMISYILFNTSFLLFPIPFIMFCGEIFTKYKKYFNIGVYAFTGYFLIRMILYMTKVINFELGLIIFHLMLVAIMAYICYLSIKEYTKTPAKTTIIALIVFVICEAIALIIFWSNNSLQVNKINFSSGFYVGIFFFVCIYAIGYIKDFKNVQEEALKAKYYQICAYTDNLTDLGNRAAFEREIEYLEFNKQNLKSIAIFMIDLNNLKETNDSNGHSEGDKLIVKMCACLQKTFKNVGNVCRIGGDEMTVIVKDLQESDILSLVETLAQNVKTYNYSSKIQIDYAIGYAYADDFSDITMHKLMCLADKKMYEDKLNKKKN